MSTYFLALTMHVYYLPWKWDAGAGNDITLELTAFIIPLIVHHDNCTLFQNSIQYYLKTYTQITGQCCVYS